MDGLLAVLVLRVLGPLVGAHEQREAVLKAAVLQAADDVMPPPLHACQHRLHVHPHQHSALPPLLIQHHPALAPVVEPVGQCLRQLTAWPRELAQEAQVWHRALQEAQHVAGVAQVEPHAPQRRLVRRGGRLHT